jgi:hypothetical protein
LTAVIITLVYQHYDRKYRRRSSVFADLMKQRRRTLSPEYVGALNLVPVEFADEPTVVKAFNDLLNHYGNPHWASPDLDTRQRLALQGDVLTATMLSTMADALGTRINQLTILHGAYAPRGWSDVEARENETRDQLLKLLTGKIPLPVIEWNALQAAIAAQAAAQAATPQVPTGVPTTAQAPAQTPSAAAAPTPQAPAASVPPQPAGTPSASPPTAETGPVPTPRVQTRGTPTAK